MGTKRKKGTAESGVKNSGTTRDFSLPPRGK